MSSDFQCTIHDPTRRVLWESLLGTDTVPVRLPVPCPGRIEGKETPVYILDADALTSDQRHQFIMGLAARFQVEPAEVYDSLANPGIAIPSTDCSVAVLNMQRWI